VRNSRYLTLEHLEALMRGIGFVQVEIKWKEGGKMVYWLYQKGIPKPTVPGQDFSKKRVLRTGNRNNFAILLS
jgi:25S rRNA (adenine2142-N1)-methyltransferase